MKMNLCVISTKNPTITLHNTINGVKQYYPEFDIVVVDSSSNDTTYYNGLPEVTAVEFCRNLNWELGAWKYAFSKYNSYINYMFIQDTLTPITRIPKLNTISLESGVFYSFHYTAKVSDGGYFDNLVDVYKDSSLSFISSMNPQTRILGAAHSSFIANKENTSYILQLENAYIDKSIRKTKIDSWLSERTVGIMADRTANVRIDITPYFQKKHGGRDY